MSETLEWKYPEELMDDNGYPTTGGTLSSGYYFHESKAYEPKKIL